MTALTLSILSLALTAQAPVAEVTQPPASPQPAPAQPSATSQQPAPVQAQPAPAQPSQQSPQQPAPVQAQPAAPQPAPAPEQSSETPPAAEQKTRMGTGWGIGVSAGTTSAIGLSARRYFDNRFGLHFGGIYIYTDKQHWGNLGVQGLYTIARGKKTRLYGLFGTQLVLSHSRNQAPMPDPGPGTVAPAVPKANPIQPTLFVGPGLGLEIHFTRHFGWAIEVPASVVIALEGDKRRLPFGGVVNFIPAANTSFTFYFR